MQPDQAESRQEGLPGAKGQIGLSGVVLNLQRLRLPSLACSVSGPTPKSLRRAQGGVEAEPDRALFLYPQQEPEGGSCQPGTAENTGAMTTSHQPQDRYWVTKGCGGGVVAGRGAGLGI